MKVTAPDAENFDQFGYSVSSSGDYIIVGARYEDGAGTARGAAYIFYRNQGGPDRWDEVAKLTASDAADNDYFGSSVSISGDYAIVGAYSEDGAGLDRGAAYVYYRNQGGTDNWGEVTKLTASDAADGDKFGYSVSISGDYAIAGAYHENGAGTQFASRGAAYVYYRNEGGADNWGEVTKLTASDTADGDGFGWSVSISGDYAIAGAPYKDTDTGTVYVYYRNEGGTDNWGEVTNLTASDADIINNFGWSVSISGDYAAMGAYRNNGAGSLRGAAYVFNRNEGGTDNWGEVKKLIASDAADDDQFGWSVSINGDYAIVGAPLDDGTTLDLGAAYVYYRNQGGADNWGEVNKLTAYNGAYLDYYGYSVSMSDDYAIVGAYQEAGIAAISRGAVYLYY